GDGTTDTQYGAFAQFSSEISPQPDGVTRLFTLPVGYIAGTVEVYIDGAHLTPGSTFDYVETSPGAGQVTLTVAPAAGSTILITCRTLAGTAGPPPPPFIPPPSTGARIVVPGSIAHDGSADVTTDLID